MNLKTFLALSLVANVVLAISLIRKPAAPDPTPPELKSAPTTQAPAKPESKADKPEPEPRTNEVTKLIEKTFGWEAVESPDYMEYIKNLRSVGCPDETIRDIIIADVNKLYAQKKKEMPVKRKEFEFWKPGLGAMGAVDTAYQDAVKKLDQEKDNLLRALGIEPDAKQDQMASLMKQVDAMMDFVSEDKKVKLLGMLSQMQEKLTKVDMKSPDGLAEMARVMRESEDAAAAILTPEEHVNYLVRFSQTANIMRMTIDGFDPSKDEYLKVFKLRHEHEREYSPITRSIETPEQKGAREAAEKVLKARLTETLGDDRYADYEMSQDGRFRQAYSAAKRSGLTVDEARTAWEMRKAAEEQAKKLRKNQELSNQARQTALEQIRNEAMTSIKELYGEQGWQNYQRGSGAAWLQQISKAN